MSAVVVGTTPVTPPTNAVITDLKVQLAGLQKELKDGKALAAKCDGPVSTCATCTQTIDNSTMYNMVKQFELSKLVLEDNIEKLSTAIKTADTETKAWDAHAAKLLEVEKYHALIDPKLSSVLLDKVELLNDIEVLQASVDSINTAITKTRAKNKTISEHNSKVKVIGEQMQDMQTELATLSASLVKHTIDLVNLQVLVKAFSTTGLVAYKIECLVKDLESITNEYLSELADGRFQLSFKIAASDKLNVVITDNGRDVDIIALSSGERARVNVATLLAIRKLMQSLSNSRTNLLILDETVENLDAEGKERLIEILLKEENLNTFLISHGFSHPLLEKLSVVKDKNISRIEA